MRLKFESTLHAKVIVEATVKRKKHRDLDYTDITITAITPEGADKPTNIIGFLHPIDIDLATDEARTEYARRQKAKVKP